MKAVKDIIAKFEDDDDDNCSAPKCLKPMGKVTV